MISAIITVAGHSKAIELELPEETTRTELLKILADCLEGVTPPPHIFLDNADKPLEGEELPKPALGYGSIFHCNPCQTMLVVARYAGNTASFDISPAAHISRVLEQAVTELGIHPNDNQNLFLQFAATKVKPLTTAHLGSVATGADCDVVFNVVSEPITNG